MKDHTMFKQKKCLCQISFSAHFITSCVCVHMRACLLARRDRKRDRQGEWVRYKLFLHTSAEGKNVVCLLHYVSNVILQANLNFFITSNFVLRLPGAGGIGELGGISLKIILTLALAWLLIFVCLMKGIKSSGKVLLHSLFLNLILQFKVACLS